MFCQKFADEFARKIGCAKGGAWLEQSGHETVTIGAVEQYITETAFANGWVHPIKPKIECAQHVGIIGAGPAGLSAAAKLREYGYQVTIYDAYDRAGGLMIYGIPNFKLEKEVVIRRTDWLEQSGVKFVMNCRIGQDKTFAELEKKHDAVLIATGVYQSRQMDWQADNLLPALDYLICANRVNLGDKPENADKLNASGKDVIVIGGGDTAMDCVRTATRQGAKSVKCVYRRDRANMPGSAREVKNAEQEGVEFIWLTSPADIKVSDNHIDEVIFDKMRLGARDIDGRKVIEKDNLAEPLALKADMVITALGFMPEDLPKLFKRDKLPCHSNGVLKVNYPSMQLDNMKNIFAAGDIARGASLVVWAVREGQDAALGIHQALSADTQAQDNQDNKDNAALQYAAVEV